MSEHTPLTEAERDRSAAALADVIDKQIEWAEAVQRTWQPDEVLRMLLLRLREALRLDAARTSTAAADTDPWASRTGASDCPERWHVHGCFADQGRCDDPTDHHAATADTGLRERVEAELDLAEQSERHVADDEVLVEVGVIRAALDATAAPTTDTGARDE